MLDYPYPNKIRLWAPSAVKGLGLLSLGPDLKSGRCAEGALSHVAKCDS